MSEHKEPIPSMIYNAAVGGHVTNSQQIIDENLNKEQSQINQETDTFINSKGNANGLATLDGLGKVPSSQLPSYVDDVIEGYYYGTEDPDTHEVTYDFYTDAEHTQKITPERGKIYLDVSTDKQYRWTGSVYSEISSSIAPDEEDLTNANGVIKFKNKAFSAQNYSGLGRIYLRKNIVNNVNILTQSMMTQANTIYIIQYDFTLDEDITVPANCVLEFNGGSLSGAYTITFNKTYLDGNININSDIILAGSIKNQNVDIRWFGAKCDGETDDVNVWNKVLTFQGLANNSFSITFTGTSYVGSSILITSNKACIEGASPNNSVIITDKDISVISDIQSIPDLFFGKTRIDNILIRNTANTKRGTGLNLNNVHASVFNNIQMQNLAVGVVLNECTLNTFNNFSFLSVTNAISVVSWSNFNQFVGGIVYYSALGSATTSVHNMKFSNIDFECWEGSMYINGAVEFDHCRFENPTQIGVTWIYVKGEKNVIHENCQFHWQGISIPTMLLDIDGENNIINVRNNYTYPSYTFASGARNNKIILWDENPYERSNGVYNFILHRDLSFIGDNAIEFRNVDSSVSITKDIMSIDKGIVDIIPFTYTERQLSATSDVNESYDTPNYALIYHGSISSFSRIIYKGVKTIQSGEEGYYTVTSVVKSDTPNFACAVGFVGGEFAQTRLKRNEWCIIAGSRYFGVGDNVEVVFDFSCDVGGSNRIDICKCTITKGIRPIMFDTEIPCQITPNTMLSQYIGGEIITSISAAPVNGQLKKIAPNIVNITNWIGFNASSANFSNMTIEFKNAYIIGIISDVKFSSSYPTPAGVCTVSNGKLVLPADAGVHNAVYLIGGVLIVEPKNN